MIKVQPLAIVHRVLNALLGEKKRKKEEVFLKKTHERVAEKKQFSL